MGTSPVSAMVVFVNGKPSKKDYRKYKIRTVVGPDDYASMREVIRRRYGRVQRDGLTPPDLIVIDGGQGQVNIAKQVIQEELGLDHSHCRTSRGSPKSNSWVWCLSFF